MSLVDPAVQKKPLGLSILEVVIAVGIVGILVGVSYPAYKTYRKRAEKAQCISHIRTLHSGLSSFLIENSRWPQMPARAMSFSEEDFFEWWIGVIEPHGVGPEVWLCPSDRVVDPEKYGKSGSYIPTLFDSHHYTPHRWSQPWLVERGDLHGKGAHVAMPDGSISTTQNPFSGY